MMKKGIAVPYIIAIILGIAVIGLIGYWFFVAGGRFGSAATLEECRTKATKWCVDAIASGASEGWLTVKNRFDENKFGEDRYPECSPFVTQIGLNTMGEARTTCGLPPLS